ncbi:hypothetical protein ACMAZD_25940 (plasmid) [Vibrio sp. nBUS_14]|uniref:hypothetical protein n=1 Tax=Vibrio sp. nBUS_14 TaxID=3395321 RepID=UPI003EBAD67E
MRNAAGDVVSKSLLYEDRNSLEKSIKAAPLLEQISQFTYIEARACWLRNA